MHNIDVCIGVRFFFNVQPRVLCIYHKWNDSLRDSCRQPPATTVAVTAVAVAEEKDHVYG